MAMLFGVLLVMSTGVIVGEVAGGVAAALAAVTCAVLSAAPVPEVCGEHRTAQRCRCRGWVAVGVVASRKGRPLVWFYAAGALAGGALSLKRCRFDGLLAPQMTRVASCGLPKVTKPCSPASSIPIRTRCRCCTDSPFFAKAAAASQ